MKKFYLVLASMLCMFVAVSFVSCDKTDDEDPTSSSSSSSGDSSSSEGGSSSSSGSSSGSGEWILPYLDWGTSQSDVRSYMGGFSGWELTSSDARSFVYHHKSYSQTLTYVFDTVLSKDSPLYSVYFAVEKCSESDFASYKSFLESKLTFSSQEYDDRGNGSFTYYCSFSYVGKSHALALSYVKPSKMITAYFMQSTF